MPQKPDLDQRLSRLYAAPVPDGFETGWRADIRREESVQTMKQRHWRPVWKRVVPALCALVLVAGALWVDQRDQQAADMSANEAAVTASRSSGSTNLAAKYSLDAEEYVQADMAAAGADMGISTYGASQETGRKLVRSASLTIRTSAFDSAVEQVQQKLDEIGGYIENLYQYGETTRTLNMSLRVPSDQLDVFLLSLEGAGKVTDRSESTTDMTTQYQDNAARLQTLYDKRDRLNELMAKAETVSDLIEIESAIADTQYQIESYETSQRSIDRQVDMSSVSLTLREQEQTVVNPELTLSQRIRAGFEDSIAWLYDMARNIVVFAAMISPVIGIALAGWLIWRIVARVRKRRKEP